MKQLVQQNPGLESRIQNWINFEDYNSSQMIEIFHKMCNKFHESIPDLEKDAVDKCLDDYFQTKKERQASFGNARGVARIVKLAITMRNNDIISTDELTSTSKPAINDKLVHTLGLKYITQAIQEFERTNEQKLDPEVESFIKKNGLIQLYNKFALHRVSSAGLRKLTNSMLNEMGIKVGDRLKILDAIEKLPKNPS